jgi:hypothetical protein
MNLCPYHVCEHVGENADGERCALLDSESLERLELSEDDILDMRHL